MQVSTNRKNVTIAMMIATFLAAIEVTVVSTAMPTIISDLGGINLISWVYAVYLLTTSVTTPIYGKLADLFGRKMIFSVGTLIFLCGSMLSGLAHSMDQLIFFRAIQGIGAGAVMPITFTIIGDIYTFEERAKMQGLFSGIWGISGILGPLVGGFFVDAISWRWIFYFNVPFGLVSLIMVWMFLHETFEKKKHQIDILGAGVFTIGATALLYALLSGGQTWPWSSPVLIALFCLAFAALLLFVRIETKVKEPILPLHLFRMRVISVSNLASFLISAVLIGINAYVPLWIQGVLGYSATGSGLTLTPMSISWTLGAIVGGRLMLKIGSRKVALIGTLCIAIASIWAATVSIHTGYVIFVCIMFIAGVGFGFSVTSFTVVVQSSVSWNLRGVATASISFVRTLGQMIGVVLFGTVFNHTLQGFLKGHSVQGINTIEDFNKLLNPEFAKQLPQPLLHTLREVFVSGISHVYLSLAVIAVLGYIATWRLPRFEGNANAQKSE
ncbi:MFS transporter [Fodinisporobacter ferrooxydans]|uniref:MFS transporter n=1 Tax=Fodinisporobacter ferrooxydans TaxID=2901836 RepID=A0ABY4CGN9_9BACL|nr:MFS transporter [Alicyclobacillaceae bacterium MYW30-H2]